MDVFSVGGIKNESIRTAFFIKMIHHLGNEIFDSILLKTVIKLTVFIIRKCKITVTFFLNLLQKNQMKLIHFYQLWRKLLNFILKSDILTVIQSIYFQAICGFNFYSIKNIESHDYCITLRLRMSNV